MQVMAPKKFTSNWRWADSRLVNSTGPEMPKPALQDVYKRQSVLPAALLPPGAKVIDVGTGAGFPGLPLRILRPDIQLTLLDSLQKRIGFLTALCQALGFADVALLHARAEDAGRDPALRGRFHIALSRAVAPFPVLLELTVPFLKVGGKSLMLSLIHIFHPRHLPDVLGMAQNGLAGGIPRFP